MRRALWLLLVTLIALVATAPPAWAQAVDVRSNVDANEIEIGDMVTYTLQATATAGTAPSDPRISGHAGFTLVESGSSPTHMVSIVNGHATEQHGLTTSWRLRADRLGTFTIGPASVAVGATRKSGAAQRVVVIAPGTGKAKPRRPGRQPFDPFAGSSPFDPFKGLFPGDEESSDPLGGLSTDPRYALDAPRAPVAFLHATIDKPRVVVGEQVVLTVYLYEDLHQRQGRPSDVHEATATDFVKRSLLQDETRAVHVGNALVGGQPWSVKLVRKNALFPIKTGKLSIAPMSLTLPQARVGLRESEVLAVEVVEPPIAGRPAGYQVGDTGDFSLSATVAPRTTPQDGAIGVTVELRGTGNVPQTLAPPEIAGVEWLEPQTKDSLGPASSEQFGGTRTFAYVVRLHREGAVDLGEIRLPYFDPRTRAYAVARAALGIVQVTKGSGRDAGVDVADAIFADLPAARTALEGRQAPSYVTERPLYWIGLFGAPLGCALAIAAGGAVGRARQRRAERSPSPERIARERRAEAERATKGTDGKAAAAAIVRAMTAEVHASTGVNLRGTASEGALGELGDAGVAEETAKEILRVLAACEDARFAPSDVAIEDVRALWKRAEDALLAAERDATR